MFFLILATVILLLLNKFDLFQSPTYGFIMVDSPEIYTRERLVNDRFIQDAWLKRLLNKEGFKPTKSISINALNYYVGNTRNDKNSSDKKKDFEAFFNNELSSDSNFIDQIDFRDRIRNIKIENELDDRHDLVGNTLHRLKFDATIIPGSNTSASAWIEVKIKPFYAYEDILTDGNGNLDDWRKLYEKWLKNLQSRLNQTHLELVNSYTNDEFTQRDYYNFLKLTMNLNIQLRENGNDANTKLCKTLIKSNSTGIKSKYSINHQEYRQCFDSLFKLIASKQPKKAFDPNKEKNGKDSVTNFGELNSTINNVDKEVYFSNHTANKNLRLTLNKMMHINTLKLVLGFKLNQEDMQNLSSVEYLNIPDFRELAKVSFLDAQFYDKYNDIYSIKPAFLGTYGSSRKDEYIVAFEQNASFQNECKNSEFNKTYSIICDRKSKNYDKLKLVFSTNSSSHRKETKSSGVPMNDYSKLQTVMSQKNGKIAVQNEKDKIYNLYISHNAKLQIDAFRKKINAADFTINFESLVKISEIKYTKDTKGLYLVKIESGLFEFLKIARSNGKLYGYSVYPKMRANNQLVSTAQLYGANAILPKTDVALSLGKNAKLKTINRKGTIVGYCRADGNDINRSAIIGWVISPQFMSNNTGRMIQAPQQQSISALVAIPSWWDKAKIEVTTKWVSENGNIEKDKIKTTKYDIHLPQNFKPLETDILKRVNQGPALYDSGQEPILLSACTPGKIIIRGKRLWRSTMVTLGSQIADQIMVLPNMKGIVAYFDTIENQSTIQEENTTHPFTISRRVRVWTSQGTISLPELAQIGVSNACSEHRNNSIEKLNKREK